VIPNDKQIAHLVKKLSGKLPGKKKLMVIDEVTDKDVKSASADDIFKEMKKLPYSD
jgi:hypothetical protein